MRLVPIRDLIVGESHADMLTVEEAVASDLNRLRSKINMSKHLTTYESTLRTLVDLWINSGRKDGVDYPRNRCLDFDLDPVRRFGTFVNKQRPHLVITSEELIGISLSMPSISGSVRPQKMGKDDAHRRFLQLFASSQRSQLARCDYCAAYWVRQRMPREGIAQGVFCAACKKSGDASDQLQKERRKKEETEWIAMAALCARRLRSKRKKTDSKAIANQMRMECERKGKECSLTGNWVTRHRPEIDAAEKRIAHGKNKEAR